MKKNPENFRSHKNSMNQPFSQYKDLLSSNIHASYDKRAHLFPKIEKELLTSAHRDLLDLGRDINDSRLDRLRTFDKRQ